jgi:hypothetical protein
MTLVSWTSSFFAFIWYMELLRSTLPLEFEYIYTHTHTHTHTHTYI